MNRFAEGEALEERWGTVEHGSHTIVGSKPENPPQWISLCVVIDEDRVLLIQDKAHPFDWELPGGKAIEGESPEETARREIREETSLEVEIVDLLKLETLKLDYGDGVLSILQPIFVATRRGGYLNLTEDSITDARWFFDLPQNMEFRDEIESYMNSLRADI
jgi:ADP-ribose pyrophosphatase YjhB (NUDIX family)